MKFRRKIVNDVTKVPGYVAQTVTMAEGNAQRIRQELKTASTEDEILDILLREEEGNQLQYGLGGQSWSEDTALFRARPMMKSTNWREEGYWPRSGFWETPAELVGNYGRLNKTEESVLYLSESLLQTLSEIRYSDPKVANHPVAITRYKIKKPFNTLEIGWYMQHPITEREKVQTIYGKLIEWAFSLSYEKFGIKAYKISNALLNLYPYIPEEAKCYSYRSAFDDSIVNLAFDPMDEENYLEYYGSVILPNYKEAQNGNLTVSVIVNENFEMMDPQSNLEWIEERFGINFK